MPLTAAAGDDGATVFKKKCATCHGKDGKGKTDMGEELKIKDLTDAATWKDLTDEKVEKQVNDGAKDESGKERMTAFKGKLSAEEIKAVVAYVRTTFAPKK
ncbi:MAG: cytochrome c [Myxococcales bacterium]|nr:cytochrome c [Myxococcales bacterium]